MKIIIQFILALLGAVILFCNPNPRFYEQEIPQTPVNLRVVANPGKTFTIFYYIQNKEDSFDGYNLYISREPNQNIKVSSFKSIIPVYTKDGTYPTLIHTQTDYDADNVHSYDVENYLMYNNNNLGKPSTVHLPFEEGVRYFFKISAHTIYNIESIDRSNEASAVAIP